MKKASLSTRPPVPRRAGITVVIRLGFRLGSRLVPVLMGSVLLVGCSDQPAPVAGRVDDNAVVLAAPALPAVSVNPDAGFAPATGPATTSSGASSGAGSGTSAAAAARAASATAPVRVAEVTVTEGQRVLAGDVVARLDVRAQRAQVTVARADLTVARAQVRVLGRRLRDVGDASGRLYLTRGAVEARISQAQAMRPVLVAQRAAAGKALAAMPAGAPQRAGLVAAVATLTRAIGQIDAGLAQARAGLAKIIAGQRRIDDAVVTLAGVRRLADAGVLAAAAGVALARQGVGAGTITAPVAGRVERVVSPGAVLAPGAAVAVIRPSAPGTITTWLPVARLAETCVGGLATVTGDWLDDDRSATVTSIGTRADYPPTSQATDEVHLTRAVPVILTGLGPLPPGAPVDITLDPCTTTPRSTS